MKDYNDTAALIRNLNELGYDVIVVDQLGGPHTPCYDSAMPLLLEWFTRTQLTELKMSLAHKLVPLADEPSVKTALMTAAREEGSSLIDLPQEADKRQRRIYHYRHSMGEALRHTARPADIDEYIGIARNPEFGGVRASVALALAKLRNPARTVPVLIELLGDDDRYVVARAIEALGSMGKQAHAAAYALEPLLHDPDQDIRAGASRALKRLGAAPAERTTISPPDGRDAAPQTVGEMTEVSSNFDMSEVGRVLQAVASVLDEGLGSDEIAAVRATVEDMQQDDELEFAFHVVAAARPTPLTIRAFLDDVDSVDLYFSAPEPLATAINEALEAM